MGSFAGKTHKHTHFYDDRASGMAFLIMKGPAKSRPVMEKGGLAFTLGEGSWPICVVAVALLQTTQLLQVIPTNLLAPRICVETPTDDSNSVGPACRSEMCLK